MMPECSQEKTKIGLVIQGPLTSYGRTGESLMRKNTESSKDIHVAFDCVSNINKIIKDFGDIFDQVVISTWKGEDTSRLLAKSNVNILKVDASDLKYSRSILQKSTNGIRQFILAKEGFKMLMNLEIEYAIKIRTDQFLALNILKEQTLTNPYEIQLAKRHEEDLLYFEDFYFGGRTLLLYQIASEIQSNHSFPRFVHHRFGFATLLTLIKEYSYFSKARLILDLFCKKSQFAKLARTTFNESVGIYSALVWNSIEWRGAKISHISDLGKDSLDYSKEYGESNHDIDNQKAPRFSSLDLAQCILGVRLADQVRKYGRKIRSLFERILCVLP